MKKKLISLLSLIMAVVMVMPVSVFAAGEDTITLYFDSETRNTCELTLEEGQTAAKWISSNEQVASVSGSATKATVTAKSDGNATITVYDANEIMLLSQRITVVGRTLTELKITRNPDKMDYYSGEEFDPKGMELTAKYDTNEEVIVKSGYTWTYADESAHSLNTTNNRVNIKYGGTSAGSLTVNVTEVLVSSVAITNYKREYTVGEKISDVRIKVTYNNGNSEEKTSGFTISNTNALTTADKDFYVTYMGVDSPKVSITVTEKSGSGGNGGGDNNTSATTYSIGVTAPPTKKNYKIGEKFDATGMTVQVRKTVGTITTNISSSVASSLRYTEYTFSSADLGKDYVDLNASFNYDGKTQEVTFRVTGLTIGNATDGTKVDKINGIKLNEESYPVGYRFTLDDIKQLSVRFEDESRYETIDGDELDDYDFADDLSLEVLNSSGKQKSSSYRQIIQSSDVKEESDGDQYVQMRLYYEDDEGDDEYLDFNVYVGESDIAFYYDGDLIKIYEELEDALTYCNRQDDDVDEDIFDIKDVDDDEEIKLVLGKDYKISSSFDEFSPKHNIVIDLNGHDLTIYEDTFEIDEDDEDYTITITNSSKTEAKLIYYDKSATITLGEDDEVEFEYDKPLPGFYTVEVTVGKGGKVSSNPSLSSAGKVEVGMGSDVKLTITPDSGYAVDNVKVDSKSVVTDSTNYKVASSGVVTYNLADVKKDTKVEITFKVAKAAWTSPYSDIKSTNSYYDAVRFVSENDLFEGYPDGTFGPNKSMTRATFVTVLGRLAGVDVTRYRTSSFTDVPVNSTTSWYQPYVSWAVDNGIVEGYGDGTFGPNNEITHQQMYLMVYRYALFIEHQQVNINSVSLRATDRSSVASWALDAVKYAQQQDLLVSETRIDPTGDALRWELATVLQTFCTKILGWAE